MHELGLIITMERERGRDRVLIIGANGYFGKRLVQASIALGHPTFILYRPHTISHLDKCQMLMGFKMEGANLLQGSLDDHESLVSALKKVDVVVSSVASDSIPEQLKLIEAIKQVGTIKRFLPSEFGMDVDRMEHAIPPGNLMFIEKRRVRRAIEAANIPYTYISPNCFAGIFLAGLAQLATFMPPPTTDHVINIYGDGDKKCIWVNEDDAAMYTMMAIDDDRTLNKVLYVRPPCNILTQMEVVQLWEKLIGNELNKTFLSKEDWLSTMNRVPFYEQIAVAHLYQIFYCGDLDFEVDASRGGVDSNDLYPDYKYVTAEEYLKRFA